MASTRSARKRLLDVLLHQPVEEWIASRRAEGATWRELSLQIRDDHDLDVTEQSLRAWALAAKASHVPDVAAAGGGL